ncbi:MAG: TusE/DsrC/DsvC family sulfur relay protein [Methylococcales bacterium]|nr:TusE/DsrC/DsvC family sulfur relay protein [Methylococcales bacterium]
MELVVEGKTLATTKEGFLRDLNDWDKRVANQLAALHALALTEAHWEILLFIRNYYQRFKHLPNTRVFVKAIKQEFGGDKGNSHYLHTLFPQGPLKYACKIAGLPKPPTCL